MIKGVIFDVDGVILDSLPRWMTAGYDYVKSCGKTPDENLGDLVYDKSFKEGTQFIKDRYGLDQPREEIEEGINQVIQDFYLKNPILKEGLLDLLNFYKDRDLGMVVCTQTARRLIEGAFDRLGILDYFQAIYTTAEMDRGKDHPDIYLRGLETLNLSSKEVLLLEDSLFALKTGHDLGLKTALVEDPYNREDKEGMEAYVDLRVSDFLKFIERGAGL